MTPRDKVVLVTGATGLLGRQVCKAFEEDKWEVVGIGYSRAKPPVRKVDLMSVEEGEGVLDEVQ